jgi:hypothetical protein
MVIKFARTPLKVLWEGFRELKMPASARNFRVGGSRAWLDVGIYLRLRDISRKKP